MRNRALGATVWLVAAWLAVTVVVSYVAGANFVLMKPAGLPRAEDAFGPMIHEPAGTLGLRYLAGELNRHFFAVYGWTQMLLGAAAVGCFLVSGRKSRVIVALLGLSFATTLLFHFHLVPDIVEIGRRLDLVPREPMTPDREAFDALHKLSVRVEVGKLVLLAWASALLVFARTGERRARAD